MSITIEGFNQQEVKPKVKKLDIASWIGTDEKRAEFQKVDQSPCGKYSAACDGYRAVMVGNVDSFFYESFNPSENFVLNLLQKVFPQMKTLKYDYNTVRVNFHELFEATQLFAKNVDETIIKEEYNKKTKKTKTTKLKIKRPMIMQSIDNNLHLLFQGTDMRATLDADNSVSQAVNKIGINPQFLLEALKFLKNRKHDDSCIQIHFTTSVAPIIIYTDDIYIFILPVRTREEGDE